MSDIFLSYASKDRDRAAEVAAALTSCGWDVWWDRTLVAGERYAAVIAEELGKARCVIVIWSQTSAASDWVTDEANEAKKRGVYLPVLLDGTEPPLGFRSAQYANLSSWTGSLEDHEFQRLLGGIRRHAGPGTTPPPPTFQQRWLDALRPSRNAIARMALASVPIAVLAISLAVFGRTPRFADVRLSLTVSQATLTFKESVDKGVLSSFPTSALTVTDFQSADLGFATLQSAEPKLGTGRVRLSAAEPPASVTFNDVQCEGIRLPAGARVTFGWRDGSLHVTASEMPLAVSVSTQPRLTLACDGCAAAAGEQAPAPLAAQNAYTFTYASPQIVTIESESPGMGLTLDASAGLVAMEGNIRLDGVEFTDADSNGRPVSSLLSGRIDWLGLNRSPRQMSSEEFLVLKQLEYFYVTRVAINAEGLALEMHGGVGQLDAGGAGNIRSELPSRLEELMSQSPWALYSAAAVAVGLSVGIFAFGRRRPRV